MPDLPVPPQNLDAEESVIGALLLSPVAIDVVLDAGLKASDFYRESHSRIFDAVLSLYTDGEPADAITVADRLDRDGTLVAVGGRERVHELASIVPSVGNVAHYAEIVREMAMLRGVILVGEQIQRLGWERPAAAAELVERAQSLVYDLSHNTTGERGTIRLRDALRDTFSRIEELHREGNDIIGVPTGFHWLDRLTTGFQRSNLIILAARPSMGKGLRLDASVLTPSGWRKNGDLSVGDLIIGGDGKPDVVTGIYDRGELDFYRVTLSDGASVDCSGDHLWLTRTRNERRRDAPGTVRDTTELLATLKRRDAATAANHAIPYVGEVEFAASGDELPIDPYWLGLYLGDGSSSGSVRFHNPEPDLQESFVALLPAADEGVVQESKTRVDTVSVRRRRRNNLASDTRVLLEGLGLAGLGSSEKFVPSEYLTGTPDERLALLQGLCDTDGYVVAGGVGIELSTASERLRDDVVFLVGSLGGRATFATRKTHYTKDGRRHPAGDAHRIVFSIPRPDVAPVRSEKHLRRWRGNTRIRGRERLISSIEPAGRAECRCITVGRGLYVTDHFIVTHNTALALGIAANVTVRSELPVALFTMEMSAGEVVQRLLSSEGLIESPLLRTGKLGPDEWAQVTTAASRLDPAPLLIDETASLTALELRSRARRLSLRVPNLSLIIVDYLQLMTSGSRAENRNQDVSQISRILKILASELRVPVLALSQLSRQVEGRHDKRPMLSDLRESGSIEQDADLVMLLYRDDYYHEDDLDSSQRGIAEINLAKHRNGPTGTVKLSFVERYAKFSEMP